MQENSLIFYMAVANAIKTTKEEKGIKYTELCYENDISTSTYDNIINAKNQATAFNIAKIIKGLGLNFEEFGRLLDKNLPKDFLNTGE